MAELEFKARSFDPTFFLLTLRLSKKEEVVGSWRSKVIRDSRRAELRLGREAGQGQVGERQGLSRMDTS